MKKSSKQAHKKLMARCEAAESALDKAEAAYAKAQTDANWNAKQKALAKCDRLWNKVGWRWHDQLPHAGLAALEVVHRSLTRTRGAA